MPARDLYHQHVVNALRKDGWTVTDDPLRLRLGKKDMYIDLAAERVLWAEKGTIKIAVEIKSFLGASDLSDLHDALGQFVLYHDVLKCTGSKPVRHDYYVGYAHAGKRVGVLLDATRKVFHILQGGKLLCEREIQGLLGQQMPFQTYLKHMLAEARTN